MDNLRRRRPPVRGSGADALDTGDATAVASELRALPELEPPGELWERIQGRLDEERATRSSWPWRWSGQTPVAAAASVAMIAVAAVLVLIHLSNGSNGDAEPAGDEGLAQQVNAPLDHHALIAALMEQSRQAEQRRRAVLAFYSPSAPEQVLRAHIGGIDAALNEQMFAGEIAPEFREALLRDRVDLMADLTDIERFRQHEFVRQVSF
ncbi:MAG: hypothetical protein F4029_13595 [Gammaproteobacteria bacterium]|nr:hypothetical protein [Gammaproteobacteria bacterium]MYF30522.1 hypothetical protein [Gammaproteobacteria bacterium]MYK47251.1 hypothetical protein [Gammaproteobacteria bacterium]